MFRSWMFGCCFGAVIGSAIVGSASAGEAFNDLQMRMDDLEMRVDDLELRLENRRPIFTPPSAEDIFRSWKQEQNRRKRETDGFEADAKRFDQTVYDFLHKRDR